MTTDYPPEVRQRLKENGLTDAKPLKRKDGGLQFTRPADGLVIIVQLSGSAAVYPATMVPPDEGDDA